MSSVQQGGSPVSAPAPDNGIWGGEQRGCSGKMTKCRMAAIGAVVACTALALGLFVGLGKSSGEDNATKIVGQAVDPNAEGCYADNRSARIFGEVMTDLAMTPQLCSDYCEGASSSYTYYALQWGKECWCGGANSLLDRWGEGECDYACAGDENLICGGYLAFTVYKIGSEATTPTPTPPSSSCTAHDVSIRETSTTVYYEGGGCGTLTDLFETQGDGEGPLYVLDSGDNVVGGGGTTPTGYWLLEKSIHIIEGSTLYVHGTSIGGDCDVLRIQSDGSGDSDFHEIRGHGGDISFHTTKVTSWDTDAGEEQTTYSGGRSFIRCISENLHDDDCAKNDMGECRMDIIDSVMGNLGYFAGESYGLTWKVRGYCTDESNPEVFERNGVYGDIQGSEIYGMYYGMYSYGHQGGVWTDNIMRDNILYGFDPHDDSDDLVIARNIVYGNGNHGIIASKRCDNVKIFDNEVYDGGEGAVGIFLHRSSDNAEVYGNYVHNMQDAGMALMESMNADIHDNTFEDVKYGIRLSLGSADNDIYDNIFDSCSDAGLYTYEGSDEPWASDGRPSGNVFESNIISATSLGVKIQDGDGNEFIGNAFTGVSTFEFDDCTDTVWTSNEDTGGCYEGDPDFTSASDGPPEC